MENVNNPEQEDNNKEEKPQESDNPDSQATEAENDKVRKQVDNPYYPYAENLVAQFKDEYAAENERENKISTKSSAFITVIVAIVTLYIPLAPFEKMRSFFASENSNCFEKVLVIVSLIAFGIGFVFLMIAFGYFIKAYGVQGTNRVNVDDLLKLASKTDEKDDKKRSQIYQGIAAHYHTILRGTLDIKGNMKINTENAERNKKGIMWTIIGFVAISIATIMLRIMMIDV